MKSDHLGGYAAELRDMHERINAIRTNVKPQGYDKRGLASAEAMSGWAYHDGLLRMTSVVLATLADEAEEDVRPADRWPQCPTCGAVMQPVPDHTSLPEGVSLVLQGGNWFACPEPECRR